MCCSCWNGVLCCRVIVETDPSIIMQRIAIKVRVTFLSDNGEITDLPSHCRLMMVHLLNSLSNKCFNQQKKT